jgi:hypothetical protein
MRNRYGLVIFLSIGASLLPSCTRTKTQQARERSSEQEKPVLQAKQNEEEEDAAFFREYVTACTEALGEPPAVSCVPDGLESIELISLGKADFTPEGTSPKDFGLYMERGSGCVNPAWIAGGNRSFGCASKQVLGRKTRKNPRGESVDWVTLCREPSRDEKSSGFEVKNFTQVGIIGYNQTTGDTCFFNIGKRTTKSGGKEFPSPAAQNAPEVYDSVRFKNWMEACTSCHILGPWVRSPLVSPEIMHEKFSSTALISRLEGAIQTEFFSKPKPSHPDGRPYVPSNLRVEGDQLVPVPYRIVFQEKLKAATVAVHAYPLREHVWTPRFFSAGTAAYCEKCHRVPLEVEGLVSLTLSRSAIRGGFPVISDVAAKPPLPYNNWHDVLFAKISEKKIDELVAPVTATWTELRYE